MYANRIPIAGWRGLPVSRSQTMVVSLWFVIPMAFMSAGSMSRLRKFSTVRSTHSTIVLSNSIASISTCTNKTVKIITCEHQQSLLHEPILRGASTVRLGSGGM